MLGEQIGLSRNDLDKLNWAALAHDIGKLEVPEELLNKPGRPTAGEWMVLLSHPESAAVYVEPLGGWLGGWIDSATQHHERYDETGYPKRLSGREISLGRMRQVVGPLGWLSHLPDMIRTPINAVAMSTTGFVTAGAIGVGSIAGAAAPAADAVHPSIAAAPHVRQLPEPASHPTVVTSTVAATSPPVDSSTTVAASTTVVPATTSAAVVALAGPMRAVEDRAFVAGTKPVAVPVVNNDDFMASAADPSTLAVSVASLHGTVEVTGLDLAYTPAAGYHGADWIVYSVCSLAGSCDSAGVSVTVTG
jgi:hypothetical protein